MTKARSVSDIHLKLCIDGKGGFLKVCLSIESTELGNEQSSKGAKYDDGVAVNKFKDS